MELGCSECGRTIIHTKLNRVAVGSFLFSPELELLSRQVCSECVAKQLRSLGERLPFTLVTIGLAITVLLAIAVPNLLASRRAANEGSAQSSLRTIASAEATYQSTVGNDNFASLEDLGAQSLIDPVLASGKKSGYVFAIIKTDRASEEIPATFSATAIPESASGFFAATGTRSFYISEDAVMFYAFGKIVLTRESKTSLGKPAE